MKPGYKTTEFWLSLVAASVAAYQGGGWIAVLPAIAYAISRGMAKQGQPPAPAPAK